jgi:hypothetical protein
VKDRPLVLRYLESLDVELIGSVHMLGRNVPRILGEIDRLAPRFVAIELTSADRKTGAMDVDAVNEHYHDRLICIDRPPEITSSRYLSGTPPLQYLRECLNRYVWLPFNHASILAFNYLYRLYSVLPGDYFYTFGWSREDTRRYIFERDEYMAARLLGRIKERRALGYQDRYAVVVGRRHVAGMAAILEAFAATGDVGSYYAGGRVCDVFSVDRLEEPYDIGKEAAAHNLRRNKLTEALGRSIFLPAYASVLFLAGAFVTAVLVVIIITTLRG